MGLRLRGRCLRGERGLGVYPHPEAPPDGHSGPVFVRRSCSGTSYVARGYVTRVTSPIPARKPATAEIPPTRHCPSAISRDSQNDMPNSDESSPENDGNKMCKFLQPAPRRPAPPRACTMGHLIGGASMTGFCATNRRGQRRPRTMPDNGGRRWTLLTADERRKRGGTPRPTGG